MLLHYNKSKRSLRELRRRPLSMYVHGTHQKSYFIKQKTEARQSRSTFPRCLCTLFVLHVYTWAVCLRRIVCKREIIKLPSVINGERRGAAQPLSQPARRSERNKLLFAGISQCGMRTHAPMNILLMFFLMPEVYILYALQNELIDWAPMGIQTSACCLKIS